MVSFRNGSPASPFLRIPGGQSSAGQIDEGIERPLRIGDLVAIQTGDVLDISSVI